MRPGGKLNHYWTELLIALTNISILAYSIVSSLMCLSVNPKSEPPHDVNPVVIENLSHTFRRLQQFNQHIGGPDSPLRFDYFKLSASRSRFEKRE
jgi:hypothetical protein